MSGIVEQFWWHGMAFSKLNSGIWKAAASSSLYRSVISATCRLAGASAGACMRSPVVKVYPS